MLELNHWNNFQVHYSLSYATPLLLARFSLSSGEPLPLRRVSFLLKVLSTIWTSHAISFWFLVFFFKVWSSIVPPEAGAWDRVSPSPHPLTGLPWIQVCSHLKKLFTLNFQSSCLKVHPCKTADIASQMLSSAPRSNYLLAFVSLYGQALGLNVSTEYAKTKWEFCSSPLFSLLPVSMPKRPLAW